MVLEVQLSVRRTGREKIVVQKHLHCFRLLFNHTTSVHSDHFANVWPLLLILDNYFRDQDDLIIIKRKKKKLKSFTWGCKEIITMLIVQWNGGSETSEQSQRTDNIKGKLFKVLKLGAIWYPKKGSQNQLWLRINKLPLVKSYRKTAFDSWLNCKAISILHPTAWYFLMSWEQ